MKEESIDLNWLTVRTGDPFADVGGRVIEFLTHLPYFKGKQIMDLIEYAADIYINSWGAKLHPFFLNSTITQAQFIGDRKREETVAYFSGMLNERIPGRVGYCEISGRKTTLFQAGRNNQILGGSGTFVNYHSSLQPGVYLSKEILIRMFFVPLGVHRLADKMALVASNNEKVEQYFVFQNCISNINALKENTSEGPLKSIFRNPANALFRFIDDYVNHLERNLNNDEKVDFNPSDTSLDLYHFSNLGQKPEMVLVTMDNDIFLYYTYCNQGDHKEGWQNFVRSYYNPDNFNKYFFNEETKKWLSKDGEEITFEEYQKWKNFVLNGLLNKRSILKYFLRWSKNNIISLELVKKYQIMIRGMRKEGVEKIEAVAQFITEQQEEYTESVIDSLNNAMSRNELRKVFVAVQGLAYRKNAKDALISAEEYIEHLLPVGSSWSELRDLLVISIYQKRNHNSV